MRLVITEPAKFRLKEIHDYYKLNVSKQIADKIKIGIVEKLRYLRVMPHAGQREEILEHLGLQHRRLIQGNYKIIYRVEKDSVIVTDIFDARRSPSEMLG
jgi:toxin ParE1/3/4